MNNTRRKTLCQIIEQLEELQAQVEDVKDEEQEALDNLPESIQESDQGTRMANNVDCLESALSYFEDLLEALNDGQE